MCSDGRQNCRPLWAARPGKAHKGASCSTGDGPFLTRGVVTQGCAHANQIQLNLRTSALYPLCCLHRILELKKKKKRWEGRERSQEFEKVGQLRALLRSGS